MPIAQRGTRAMLAAALTIVPAASTSSSCGGGGSKTGTPVAANPFINHCTAATKVPTGRFPGPGVIGGFVKVTCDKPADVYNLDVYLNWNTTPGDPAENEIVDQCYQYEPEQLGTRCTVASACKPGYWSISWDVTVDIGGATGTSRDTSDYHHSFTAADCKSIAG